ncbi:hypothetical protein GCM10010256_23570 [Streptomyces coeruleorubidus]|nr:hypothetical protein GCM10010256_23570 [Streptomyces coeruleorubidus]
MRREGRRGSQRATDTHFCDVSHLLPTGGKRVADRALAGPPGSLRDRLSGGREDSRQPYVSPGPVLPGARSGP